MTNWPGPGPGQRAAQLPLAIFVFGYTSIEMLPVVGRGAAEPPGFEVLASVVGPFRSFNTYGLFAL